MCIKTAQETLDLIKSKLGTREGFALYFTHDGKTIVNPYFGNTCHVFVINSKRFSMYGVYGEARLSVNKTSQIDNKNSSDEDIKKTIQNYLDLGCTLSFDKSEDKEWIDADGSFRYYDESADLMCDY